MSLSVGDLSTLADGTTLLHVGAPKTGTTSLQAGCVAHSAELRAAGVLYPHLRADDHALSLTLNRAEPTAAQEAEIADFVGRLRGERRLTFLSDENLSGTSPARVRVMLDRVANGPVHVVLTLRNFADMLPSYWQQRVKGARPASLDDFLRECLADPSSATLGALHAYRSWKDGLPLPERWARIVGPENVTVIVLDRTDRQHLSRAFGTLLGVDPAFLSAPDQNLSLTVLETEYLRALYEVGTARRDDLEASALARDALSMGVARRAGTWGEEKIGLPTWAIEPVGEFADALVASVERSGVRVCGDLSQLAEPPRRSVARPPERPAEVPIALAVAPLVGLASWSALERSTVAEVPAPVTGTRHGKAVHLVARGAPTLPARARRGLLGGAPKPFDLAVDAGRGTRLTAVLDVGPAAATAAAEWWAQVCAGRGRSWADFVGEWVDSVSGGHEADPRLVAVDKWLGSRSPASLVVGRAVGQEGDAASAPSCADAPHWALRAAMVDECLAGGVTQSLLATVANATPDAEEGGAMAVPEEVATRMSAIDRAFVAALAERGVAYSSDAASAAKVEPTGRIDPLVAARFVFDAVGTLAPEQDASA
ncbi:hypothetical protein [Demequina sp. NBRC 110054]|uniref:hypothetical protein n=1 Tax=Demequina sp. NBRC 110054 TaxID=1570343 RepID=UPI000A02F527|nr:hypothetical protein [Demequina sp. NBRC 110054]